MGKPVAAKEIADELKDHYSLTFDVSFVPTTAGTNAKVMIGTTQAVAGVSFDKKTKKANLGKSECGDIANKAHDSATTRGTTVAKVSGGTLYAVGN